MNRNTNKLKRLHSKNDGKQSPAKRKFRNENEKRRRDLFSQLITNLEDALSIKKVSSSNDQTNKLDKASILRQAVVFLQNHHQYLTSEAKLALSNSIPTLSRTNEVADFLWKPPSELVNIDEWLEITIESMHCFFLVVKSDPYSSEIVYVSNKISSYLGYSPHEVVNRSLFEFILPSNHDRLRDYILNDHKVLETCDLYWKRPSSDDYEQCSMIGAFRTINENEKYLMSIIKLNSLDRTLIIDIDNSTDEFITHLNIYGRFIFIHPKARQLLGYSSFELIGRTHFDFVHPDDLAIISRAHQLWKEKGNGKSDPYRFLTKGQQWVFLQTYSQVQINSWTGKPDSYICTTSFIQCSNDSIPKPMSFISIDIQPNNSNINPSYVPPSTTTTAISYPSNIQDTRSSSDSEIKSFLSHLGNEIYRKNICEKLIERRKTKQLEIQFRQDEIQVIDDMLQFINQYQIKHSTTIPLQNQQTKNIPTEDLQLNIFDINCDFNSPLAGIIEDYSIRSNLKDDPLASLFSPSSITFNLSSPMTPFSNPSSNNDTLQDNNYLTSNRNSSTNDKNFPQNTFS